MKPMEEHTKQLLTTTLEVGGMINNQVKGEII